MYNALIIEDDLLIRTYLKRIIQKKFPFDINEAENGMEGLESLKKVKPDLIFLDISMPVMNGLQFLEKIKLDPAHSNIPIIILTAHKDWGTIQRMVSLGISDYILKPINPENTYARVQKILDNLK